MTSPPASATVSRALVSLLEGYGVDTVFGIPGNHTVELYRHLTGSGIRHVTSRHEQGAAFMADGFARASGRPGVCLLISGPGLLNAATPIAQARADSVPLLLITAVAARRDLGMGRGTLHELPDQHASAASLCRASHTLLDPDNLADLVHGAFVAFAAARPGPVHLEIPLDLMRAPCGVPLTPRALPRPAAPAVEAVAAAAARLDAADAPLILVGGGAVGAGPAISTLAERLDAPVLNTVNGKGICPSGHPQAVGGSPSLPGQRRAIATSDCLLAIGTELAETDLDLLMAGPVTYPAEVLRLDIDAAQLARQTPASLPLLGDAGAGVRAMLDVLGDPQPGSGRGARAAALRAEALQEAHHHAEIGAFLDTVRSALADGVLVGDSTRPTYYAAWQYECPAPRRYFHSVSGFGTLGYAIPAAFGAALAGHAPVAALIGDGGAQFTWPELLTGVEAGLAVPVIVWCNDGYEEIANSMQGVGVDATSTRIRAPDFAAAAAAFGCHHVRARDLSNLTAAISGALQADAPTVIEVRQKDFVSQPSGQWYA